MSDEWVWFKYRWMVPKKLMRERGLQHDKIGGPRFLTIKNGIQYRWCIWLYPEDRVIHYDLSPYDRSYDKYTMSFVLWLDKGSIQNFVVAKYKLEMFGRDQEEEKECGPTTFKCPSGTKPKERFHGLRQEGLFSYEAEDLDDFGFGGLGPSATWVQIWVCIAVQKRAFDVHHLFPDPPLNFSPKRFAQYQQIVLGDPTECQNEGVIVLVAGTERISCHQAVLDEASPVFQRMFTWTNSESQAREVVIEDVSAGTIKQLLHFLYVGSLLEGWQDDNDDALALLYAAHKYDIKGLPRLCETAAVEQLSLETAMEALKMGKQMGLGLLELTAAHFLFDHWNELPKAEKKELNSSRALQDIVNAKKAVRTLP